MNANSDSQHIKIALNGISGVKRSAMLTTLSGKTPDATNSLTHPDAVVPVEHHIDVSGPAFERNFEPHSINVLDLSY